MGIKCVGGRHLLRVFLPPAVLAFGPGFVAGVLVLVQVELPEVLSEVFDHLKLNYRLEII